MDPIFIFLIVCPLVFVAGFIDAIAGGGGLISLPAYLITGLPVHTCLGTNKLSSCMGTAVATLRYALQGFVEVKRCVVCVIFALAGSALGANIALMIDDAVFRVIMLVVVPVTAAYIMFHKDFKEKEPIAPAKSLALCAAISAVVGVYDGVYGPGTGTFLTLLFMGVGHLKLTQATGTCKVVNLATNVAALTVFISSGVVWLPLGLVAGCFNMLGAYIGTRCFIGKGVRIARPVMLTVLVIFFVKLLLEVTGVIS